MEVKVSYKKKNKKDKNMNCPDLSSLKAWLLERYPEISSNISIKYIPDKETGIFNLDSEEAYRAMRLKYQKIRLFIDPSKEELDEIVAAARSSTQSKQKQNNELKEEKPSVKEDKSQTKKEELKQQIEQPNPPLLVPSKSHNPDEFYVCRICSKKYPDGVRYRCLGCLNFDVCEVCFNKGDHLSEAPHNLGSDQHEFVSIESKQQFQSYDFRELFRLLLDPSYRAKEHYATIPITHSDIIKESQHYLQEMKSWERQYERRVNNDIDQWIQDFQKLKNKQVK